jgi:hypothetical protein
MARLAVVLLLFASLYSASAYVTPNQGPNSCKKEEFWYESKGCCLTMGGPPNPPEPPKDSKCPPSGWYWRNEQECCVPRNPPPPNPPPPQCPKQWEWVHSVHKCQPCDNNPPPPPAPSSYGGPYGNGGDHGNSGNGEPHNQRSKRVERPRTSSPCPAGLEACPISSLIGGSYECIDIAVELESCGGCSSLGEGQDCTAIPGAWNVGCEQGACAVYTCSAGFRRSQDGKSCIAL